MKILFTFLSLINFSLGASIINISNPSYYNRSEDDSNETLFQITTPQDKEQDGEVSRWVVLMTPRVLEDDSSIINTIRDEPLSEKKKTEEHEPYTFFESYMDPSNPENYGEMDSSNITNYGVLEMGEFNPLKSILSSIFSFQPWPWNDNDDDEVIEKYSATEPTPSSKLSSNKDELPETLVLPTPPTEETTESVTENEIESSLSNDLENLDEIEKLAMKLDDKEKVEFILDDDSESEFYKQQLELLKSMENTLLKLKTYFDKETETQETLLDKSWANSLVIASVGVIYLLLIFAFFSFKSLFETDKEQKEFGSVLDHPHQLPTLITEKSVQQV